METPESEPQINAEGHGFGKAVRYNSARVKPLEILSAISRIQTIAAGRRIRELRRLRRMYGAGRWRKLKGFAVVKFDDGTIWFAEVHWYEAHGIGKKEFKVKEKIRQL